MSLALYLFGLQCALAAAGLCRLWSRTDPLALRGRLAAAGALGFQVFALGCLAPKHAELSKWMSGASLGMTAALTIGWMFYTVRLVMLDRRPGSARARTWVRRSISCAVILHVLTLLVSAGFLDQWFGRKWGQVSLPAGALGLGLALGLAGGAFLVGATVHAYHTARRALKLQPDAHANPDQPTGRLIAACHLVESALTLRMLVILVSLLMGAVFNPVAPAYFVDRILSGPSSVLLLRLLLGLALPVLFVWASIHGARQAPPQPATPHLLLALILVLFGELLAACLTVGLWGLAM